MTPRIGLLGGCSRSALCCAVEHSPYLARLARQRPDIVEVLDGDIGAAVAAERASLGDGHITAETAWSELRRIKAGVHLLIAAADLGGELSLEAVTNGMSDFADGCVGVALGLAWERAVASGHVLSVPLSESGLFVLAMGKLGSRGLNYSSDIDLIFLFDPDRFACVDRWPARAAVSITSETVRILHEITEHGYVFRVDLRLRPDPGSSAIAVSASYALTYYESLGQNWERMAYIKARFCAGDAGSGGEFLRQIEPFIWRRVLDYWTISDIHALVGQIHASGKHHELDDMAFDVKLGRGGIREIEFIVQTQQLILGGRNPNLRTRSTIASLAALAEHQTMTYQQADELTVAYRYLRVLEHRIQMVNDEQTHLLSAHAESRRRVQALCGVSMDRLDGDIALVRHVVHGAYSRLFEQKQTDPDQTGNLVFTGVENDPGTVETLRRMGFSDSDMVISTLQYWHRGGLPATSSSRGRALLTKLTPPLLHAMSRTGSADIAFSRFAHFITELRVGVQVFSLLLAESVLRDQLISAMVIAPKLAGDIARRPDLLDAMLDPDFNTPVGPDNLTALRRVAIGEDFEVICNAARLCHRESVFRISWQLIRGQIGVVEAGMAYAALASSCVRVLADAALEETQRRFGHWSAQWVVCGLGQLGGQDMTATSDVDLMLIYRSDGEGGENLAARFAQRLISALSAPTEEGSIYEVDMRLRPSGRAGPVAVKLSAFERYYRQDAWTWEYMALTKLRPIAGDSELSGLITALTGDLIAGFSGDRLDADVLDMRRRLARERPAYSKWDVKLAPGGLFDINFVVQHAMLSDARRGRGRIYPSMIKAMRALTATGAFSCEESALLVSAYRFQTSVLHCLSVASSGRFDPEAASFGLTSWLAERCGESDISALEASLDLHQRAVISLREKRIGSV